MTCTYIQAVVICDEAGVAESLWLLDNPTQWND